jgi:hypothetical protein
MNVSWALCHHHERGFALFPGMEPADFDIYATLPQISHVSGGTAAKVLWTVKIHIVTFLIMPA